MPEIVGGPRTWSLGRDDEGYKTYKVKHIVKAALTDGPNAVLNTPGLPLVGSPWAFLNDFDPWAFCTPNASVSIHQEREGDPARFYVVENTFSTKPMKACHETPIEDPILQPPKLSGSFVKYQEEATHDRFNRPIISSSWEQYRGPQVEFDKNRPTVHFEQNVLIFDLPLVAAMLDTVNDANLWGLLPRMVKLSGVTWERLYYGQCYVYYHLALDFDINYETFDRILLDEGNKVLQGEWHPSLDAYVVANIGGAPADPFNPAHFKQATDRAGNPIRVVLDGRGLPAGTQVIADDPNTQTGTGTTTYCTEIGNVLVQKYDESNLLLLGIPPMF